MRLSSFAIILAAAAALAAAPPVGRYHFGDDPRWSDPNFDDSSWPEIKNGEVQAPPLDSDGVLWARVRAQTPSSYTGPLAIYTGGQSGLQLPEELWVDGRKAGAHGSFPPHPYLPERPDTSVFNLPGAESVPGQKRVLAIRTWLPPAFRLGPGTGQIELEIGPADLMQLRQHDDIASSRIESFPHLMFSTVFFVLGLGLLIIWSFARGSREVFWFGFLLVIDGCLGFEVILPNLIRTQAPAAVFLITGRLLSCLVLISTCEFVWAVFALRWLWLLRLLEAVLIIRFISVAAVWTQWQPAPWMHFVSPVSLNGILLIFSVNAGIGVWRLLKNRGRRGVALAIVLLSLTVILENGTFGARFTLPTKLSWGALSIPTELIALLVLAIAVIYLLLGRLWRSWRHAQDLETEFEAARQMQQSLVSPVHDEPGFEIASAYLPAKEVGGDFFWLFPDADGSLLLVAGDVSGKGLQAAMTVAAIGGALRNEASRRPGQVLANLNRVLVGRAGNRGFTTCCAARFDSSGQLTLANAGHVAPYLNGEEVEVEPGLPLGIIPDVEYAETELCLAPADRLTFVSDGVVEARNSDRELLGYDRMRELSTRSATEIAKAAVGFGQEDDISVVTVGVRSRPCCSQ